MGYSFDGITKIITLTSGTTEIDVVDLYSRWKDWIKSNGSKFPQAIYVVGGDPVNESAGIYVTSYFFLLNGWRIKPQEANHTLNVIGGVLLVDGGGDPFIDTNGYYIVRINYSQPTRTETIKLPGGSGLTSDEHSKLYDTNQKVGVTQALVMIK